MEVCSAPEQLARKSDTRHYTSNSKAASVKLIFVRLNIYQMRNEKLSEDVQRCSDNPEIGINIKNVTHPSSYQLKTNRHVYALTMFFRSVMSNLYEYILIRLGNTLSFELPSIV